MLFGTKPREKRSTSEGNYSPPNPRNGVREGNVVSRVCQEGRGICGPGRVQTCSSGDPPKPRPAPLPKWESPNLTWPLKTCSLGPHHTTTHSQIQ